MSIPLFIGLPGGSAGRNVVAGLIGALGIGGAILFWPAGSRGISGPRVPIVYVCTETAETFVGDLQGEPAINPKTGRRTLVRGMFCLQCERWNASQPSNHRAGNPRAQLCRVHHVEMTYDGPTESLPSLP